MQKIVTNSMRCTFLDCPYRFFLEYVCRYSPIIEADYFKWGRCVHAGMSCRDHEQPIEKAITEIREETMERCPPLVEIEEIDEMCTLLPTVLDAHLLKWHEDDENYEILGGESYGGKFSLPLPSGWLFKGKIDKLVRDIRSGKNLTWERKTAATIDDDYWEDVLLDSQPKGYLLAAQRCFGIQTRDVLYELFGKPQIRQKKWQTREMFIKELGEEYLLKQDKYLHRRRMPFEQADIDAYYWEIDQVAQMLQWHLEEGIWPKHHPKNRIGGCAYKPICLRDDTSKFYVRPPEKLNPELV